MSNKSKNVGREIAKALADVFGFTNVEIISEGSGALSKTPESCSATGYARDLQKYQHAIGKRGALESVLVHSLPDEEAGLTTDLADVISDEARLSARLKCRRQYCAGSGPDSPFEGGFPSRAAAWDYGNTYSDTDTFCTGVEKPPPCPSSLVRDVWERIVEATADDDEYSVEWAERWDISTPEQRKELDELVRVVVREWMGRHDLAPTFFNAVEIQEHRRDWDGGAEE